MQYTAENRTSDFHLASYLVAVQGYQLRSIEGPPARRVFVFDKAIPVDLLRQFHFSPEKRLLDIHKSLKVAVVAGT